MNVVRFHNDDRAVSATIGVILIIGLIVVSSGVILALGGTILTESQTTADEDSTDQAMTQLDSQMSLVAFEGGSEQTVDLAAGSDEQVTIEDSGHISLDLMEINETDPTETEVVESILDEELHSLEYQSDDRTVAYQGSGVWSMNDDDPETGEMVSPPEFSYDSNTATLPFVMVDEDEDFVSSDGEITMSRGESEGLYPQQGEENLTNPVDSDYDLVLTIESPYYQAWGQYFEDRLHVSPGYDHDNNEIEVTLVTEGDEQTISTALTSVGGDNRIDLRGQGTGTIVDSYNSNEGPYEDSYGENGSIHAASGITHDNGMIRGDIVTEGDYIMRGNAEVTGDAAADGDVQKRGGSNVQGEITQEASVEQFRPIDQIIEAVRDSMVEENDNSDSTAISDGEITTDRELDTQNSETTFHSGDFYVTDLSSDDDLTFDLSDGDIRVLADDSIDLENSDVEVINTEGNDHRVEVFTRSDSMGLSNVEVDGDQSPSMWFYAGSGTQIDIYDSVTGVIYAPGTSEIPGDLTVHSHADLFGASVAGNSEVENQATYHYDEALDDTPVFADQYHLDQVSAVISYFHISHTEIQIED